MGRFRPILPLSKRTMSTNDLRQCLRVAFGGVLGFIVCKLAGTSYGAFYTVTPMLLLGMIPILNAHILRQFVAGTLLVTIVVLIVHGVLGDKPVPMILFVAGLFALLFRAMARGPNFLFGATSIVSLSMLLHFASYPASDVLGMVGENIEASLLSLAIVFVMHWLFPDVGPRAQRPRVTKPLSNQRHETILATAVATLSFIAFQVMDLRGSLSAQVATILVLFPLTWKGAGPAGWNRAIGTLVACNAGLIIQLLLFNHFNILPLVAFSLWLGLMIFARYHMLEGGGSGAGFAGLTTMAILFGQYLTPQSDLVYSDLYRFSSLSVAVLASLMAVYIMHHLLNRFASTRLQE